MKFVHNMRSFCVQQAIQRDEMRGRRGKHCRTVQLRSSVRQPFKLCSTFDLGECGAARPCTFGACRSGVDSEHACQSVATEIKTAAALPPTATAPCVAAARTGSVSTQTSGKCFRSAQRKLIGRVVSVLVARPCAPCASQTRCLPSFETMMTGCLSDCCVHDKKRSPPGRLRDCGSSQWSVR